MRRPIALRIRTQSKTWRCLWPESYVLGDEVPESVQSEYTDAYKIRSHPKSFVIQIGVALEAICDDQSIKKAKLYKMLIKLVEKTNLPAEMEDAAEVIKFFRNAGAHFDGVEVRPSDAELVDEFFRALIEYIYIAPARSKRYRELISRHETRKAQANPKPQQKQQEQP